MLAGSGSVEGPLAKCSFAVRLNAMRYSPLGTWNRLRVAMVYSVRHGAPRNSSAVVPLAWCSTVQAASSVNRTWYACPGVPTNPPW